MSEPTPRTDALRDLLIQGNYEPHHCFEQWQKSHAALERESERWKEKYRSLDRVIDELNIARSCISPEEDLRRAVNYLKEQIQKLQS